ncbi:hypothetical protein GGH12_000933 [Coemansia sp. RSA 1822]|nr:hypothetical protein LPJ76_000477 [Coemansia sp. RSA 638]KAJ2541638.1 hypothetical protein GGF49_003492 [Coemansia sp. RSA 1853]KAJ2566382.1 hypothetical protein GGH12_000933 [Coemansia sp. RSA 1822]
MDQTDTVNVAHKAPVVGNMQKLPYKFNRRAEKDKKEENTGDGEDGDETTTNEKPTGSETSNKNTSNASSGDAKSFRAPEPELLSEKTFTGTAPERLIFIGDIHGCSEEFGKLLETVNFKQGSDQVILVGDLVAKGPDSLGVVNKARSIKAWGVRGNHDDRVIRWGQFLQGPAKGMSESELKELEDAGELPYDDFELSGGHYDIASTMPACDFSYFSQFSALITLPEEYSEWVVAHGGMEPTKPIAEQDPEVVMTVRNIGPDGPSSEKDAGDAWFEVWADAIGPLGNSGSSAASGKSSETAKETETGGGEDDTDDTDDTDTKEKKSNRKRQSSTSTNSTSASLDEIQFKKVIYGHDAGRALQIHEITKGLDSRCVYGGELTAFILPGEELKSVPCQNYDGKDASSDNRRRRREFLERRALSLRSRRRRRRMVLPRVAPPPVRAPKVNTPPRHYKRQEM